MTTLLKTNTNKYKNNFKTSLEATFKDSTFNEIKDFNDFLKAFDSEFNHNYNKRRLPNLCDRLADYLMGSPLGFNFIYGYQKLEFAAELHEINEIPKDKEDIIINNFYNHCASMILRLANKELVNKLY